MNLNDIQGIKPFKDTIPEECQFTLPQLTTLQMNITYRCNLACKHCHLECGADRQEMMSQETMEDCLAVFTKYGFSTLDITGGAPELNPHLPWLRKRPSIGNSRDGSIKFNRIKKARISKLP